MNGRTSADAADFDQRAAALKALESAPMSTEPTASRPPVDAVEFIDTELERSRRKLADVLDRIEALAELLQVAVDLEDARNEGRAPRARQALSFDALLDVRGDEQTRGRVAALTARIATEEEP